MTKTTRCVDVCACDQALVLVVDDNSNNLLLMREVLEGTYAVRCARSGDQALAEAARLPHPALILLDVMMPGMDGFEVIARLRADPATAGIPVIFVTAKETYEDEEQGLLLGAVDYVTKPINPAVLLARLRTHLELKQARDALAAHNANLEAEVARRLRDIQIVQEVTVRALASLGETRDTETGMHIRRTQAYIDVLGRHLMQHPRFAAQLAGRRLAMIVNAAPLHDIGKIGIRDSILLKPGKLSAEEFEIMRTHADIGAEAIDRALAEVAGEHGVDVTAPLAQGDPDLLGSGPLDFLWVAREIVASHHEKWDGSGYPQGLAGEAIPVAARLMALADAFDALLSQHIYKKPMPLQQVERMIADGRGTHFDPEVVDAFFACKADFVAIAEQYADRAKAAK